MKTMKFKLAKVIDLNSDLSKTWYVEYYFEHPETGKFQQFKRYVSKKLKTKQARYARANEIKNEINDKLVMGWNPFEVELPSKKNIMLAFKEAMKRKQVDYTSNRSVHTVQDSWTKFSKFLINTDLNNIPVEQFSRHHALMFLDWLVDHYNISNRTRNNHLSTVKSIFNFMISRDWIQVNPFSRVAKLPTRETQVRLYSREDLHKIEKHLPGYNYDLYIIAMLVYYCALRPQEIVRLKRMHFNSLESGVIAITGDISKNTKSQAIAVPKAFVADLQKKDWNFPANYYVFSRQMHPGIYKIAPTRIAEAWRAFCRKYKIPDEMKLYDLKHTGGGMAVEAGINVRDIQLQMRHSSLNITEQYLKKFANTASDNLIDNFPDFGSIADDKEYRGNKKKKP